MKIRLRSLGVSLTGAIAIALAVTAVAWACTPSQHEMEITSPATKAGTNGTHIVVAGHCVAGGPSGHACTDEGGRDLYMDTKTSVEAIQLAQGDHQTLCTATDQDIGYVTALSTGGTFTGEGDVNDPPLLGAVPQQSNNRLPGGYIVCAGINVVQLWDYFYLV